MFVRKNCKQIKYFYVVGLMLYRVIEERKDSEHIFISKFLIIAGRQVRVEILRVSLNNHSSGAIAKEKDLSVMCSLFIHYNMRAFTAVK